MTLIAPDAEKLRELDDETRRAWYAYRESVHDLCGEEYARTEDRSWEELQAELREVEDRRRMLVSASVLG